MTTRHEVDLLRRRAFAGSLPRSRRKGAFNPITHILLGWLIAHLGSSTRALRTWCLIAAIAPDVDGLGLLFGRETYVRYHHVLAHNFLFLALVTAVSACWVGWRPWDVGRVFASGLVHLYGDYWGSGPGWPLYVLLPFDDTMVLNEAAWEFNGAESRLIFAGCVLASCWIARRAGRTPFESLTAGMDRALADLAAWTRERRCECGRAGIWLCQRCRTPLCRGHALSLGRFGLGCADCAAAGSGESAGKSG
ncbi:MAG: metal-dependent hydrolase [Candidatus Wallbacteria bacterium]|nr:metal-dependent hydrolase [Candidatus Wallbacteria bacterium]